MNTKDQDAEARRILDQWEAMGGAYSPTCKVAAYVRRLESELRSREAEVAERDARIAAARTIIDYARGYQDTPEVVLHAIAHALIAIALVLTDEDGAA